VTHLTNQHSKCLIYIYETCDTALQSTCFTIIFPFSDFDSGSE